MQWVMSHIWMSHAIHTNESCYTYECDMSHIRMRHVTHMNESCHTYEWVMSMTPMSNALGGCHQQGKTYVFPPWENSREGKQNSRDGKQDWHQQKSHCLLHQNSCCWWDPIVFVSLSGKKKKIDTGVDVCCYSSNLFSHPTNSRERKQNSRGG